MEDGSGHSTARSAWLSIIQGWLPFVTLVGGALWGLYTYINHEEMEARLQAQQNAKEAKVRVFEASKPFFDKMLNGFAEMARLVGVLTTAEPASPPWLEAEESYLRLTNGELRLFGVPELHVHLDSAEAALARYKADKSPASHAAFRVACRALLQEMSNVPAKVYEAHGFLPD